VWTADITLSEAHARLIGEHYGDSAGYSVSGAGDVNGDGFDDLLIGATNNSAYLFLADDLLNDLAF